MPATRCCCRPACASFDMFSNYAHRAEVFGAAVQALADDARGRCGMTATRRRFGLDALQGARRCGCSAAQGRQRRAPMRCRCALDQRRLAASRRGCWASTRRWSGSPSPCWRWGLVMVYSAPRSRCPTTRTSRATRRPTSWTRHACFDRRSPFVAALLAFQVPMATWEQRRALALRRLAAAAGRGADSRTSARASTARAAGSRWAS